ncbi:MAG: hypothetical protein JST50_18500 [Bacteroidetes bacterium]|jgi:hypothetical protein|nr:hypothetical protein [Bacteroidota bacterium]
MKGLSAFKIFFAFAALLFIAKPFCGFEVTNHHFRIHISHNILVKSFSKRKPESLDDADKKAAQIYKQLANPLMVLLSSISMLLLMLLPVLFDPLRKITSRLLSDIRLSLLPPENTYLLAGKLII